MPGKPEIGPPTPAAPQGPQQGPRPIAWRASHCPNSGVADSGGKVCGQLCSLYASRAVSGVKTLLQRLVDGLSVSSRTSAFQRDPTLRPNKVSKPSIRSIAPTSRQSRKPGPESQLFGVHEQDQDRQRCMLLSLWPRSPPLWPSHCGLRGPRRICSCPAAGFCVLNIRP